jgi:hypothetical protein
MQPSWELLGLFSAGSAALGAIATAGIINAINRRKSRDSEPSAKRQKLSPPSPARPEQQAATAAQQELAGGVPADREPSFQADLAAAAETAPEAAAVEQHDEDAAGTPEAEVSGAGHIPQTDSVVDLQKLQELEQRVGVADQYQNYQAPQHEVAANYTLWLSVRAAVMTSSAF